MHKLYSAGKESVMNVNPNEVKEENNYNLIHCTGALIIDRPLEEKVFKFQLNQVVSIRRSVEAYQWVGKKNENMRYGN